MRVIRLHSAVSLSVPSCDPLSLIPLFPCPTPHPHPQLEAYVVDVVSTSNGIFVILMNDTLAAYGWNGERLGSKHLPAAPVAIDALPTRNLERESSLVVGLASGAVQVSESCIYI